MNFVFFSIFFFWKKSWEIHFFYTLEHLAHIQHAARILQSFQKPPTKIEYSAETVNNIISMLMLTINSNVAILHDANCIQAMNECWFFRSLEIGFCSAILSNGNQTFANEIIMPNNTTESFSPERNQSLGFPLNLIKQLEIKHSKFVYLLPLEY